LEIVMKHDRRLILLLLAFYLGGLLVGLLMGRRFTRAQILDAGPNSTMQRKGSD